jgi:hypothetical protein
LDTRFGKICACWADYERAGDPEVYRVCTSDDGAVWEGNFDAGAAPCWSDIIKVCTSDDGAVWEGNFDAGAAPCWSDIVKVTGHFEKCPVVSLSIISGGEGAYCVELM